MNTTPKKPRYHLPAGHLTKQEAGELLSVSQSTVNRLIASGALVPVKIAYRKKPLLFALEAVRRLLDGGQPARLVTMPELRKARRA